MKTSIGLCFVLLGLVAAASSSGCAEGARLGQRPSSGEGGSFGEGGSGGSNDPSGAGGATAGGGAASSASAGAAAFGATTGAGVTTAAGSGAGGAGGAGTGAGGDEPCSESPCKLVAPQCGCADGQACSVKATGRYCTAAGDTPIGQACNLASNCMPGALCVKTSGTVSTCMPFCASDGDCQPPGGLCILNLSDGKGGQIPDATICTENCDPVTSTGCPVAGTGCQLGREADGQMRFFTRCTGAGSGKQKASCPNGVDDCAPGYSCFTVDATDMCLKFCEVSAPAPGCPGGTVCTPIQIDDVNAQIGNVQYGACL